MLYRFPEGTRGIVRRAYTRPYPDPIRGKAGDAVTPDFGKTTGFTGVSASAIESGVAAA